MAGSRRKCQVVIYAPPFACPWSLCGFPFVMKRVTTLLLPSWKALIFSEVCCHIGMESSTVVFLPALRNSLCFLLQNKLQVSSLLHCPGSSQGNSFRKLLLPYKCIFFWSLPLPGIPTLQHWCQCCLHVILNPILANNTGIWIFSLWAWIMLGGLVMPGNSLHFLGQFAPLCLLTGMGSDTAFVCCSCWRTEQSWFLSSVGETHCSGRRAGIFRNLLNQHPGSQSSPGSKPNGWKGMLIFR